MIDVRISKLGYIDDFDMNQLVVLLNKPQRFIDFTIDNPIINLGETKKLSIYNKKQLINLFDDKNNDCIRVGITQEPLDEIFYIPTQSDRFIIITLYKISDLISQTNRTKEGYIAQLVIAELLWLQYRKNRPKSQFSELFYGHTRNCIFDLSAYSSERVQNIKGCRIDLVSKGKLIDANVPENIIMASEKILARIRKPSFRSTLKRLYQLPLFSFFLGGLIINTTSSLLLGDFDTNKDFYVFVTLLLVMIIMAVVNYILEVTRSR